MSSVDTESDRLLVKYLDIKREIHSGRKKITDADDEQIAGLLIRLFGSDALVVFRTLPKLMRRAYRKKWPRTEGILEKAFMK